MGDTGGVWNKGSLEELLLDTSSLQRFWGVLTNVLTKGMKTAADLSRLQNFSPFGHSFIDVEEAQCAAWSSE